jgi:hypothetical protein
VPTLVAAPLGKLFVNVSNSGFHMVAITRDGACYTWGEGAHGRLGHGDQENFVLPKQVAALAGKRVVAVAAGDKHSAVITAEGDLFTWGGGSDGVAMLGQDTASGGRFNSPTSVPRAGGIPWRTPAPAPAGMSEATNAAANAVVTADEEDEEDVMVDRLLDEIQVDLAGMGAMANNELDRERFDWMRLRATAAAAIRAETTAERLLNAHATHAAYAALVRDTDVEDLDDAALGRVVYSFA